MAMLRPSTFRFFLPLVGALLIAGCAKKIDGSTEETYRASIFALTKDLPPEKRAEFQEALSLVTLKSLNLGALFSGETSAAPNKSAREQLNGKTVEQVIQLGQEVRAEREKARKTGAKRPVFKGPVPLKPDLGAPPVPAKAGQPQA